MKNGWRVILTIVVVAILLGAICFGVGLLTGANPDRILQTLNQDYHLTNWVDTWIGGSQQLVQRLVSTFRA